MSTFLAQQGLKLLRESLKTLRWSPRVAATRSYVTVDDDGDTVPEELKTTVTILNESEDDGIFLDTYSPLGFRLTNGVRVMGPCAVFPRSILHWNIASAASITPDSLSLFTMLYPKIDLLILGVGERENLKTVDPEVIRYLRSHKINIEVLPTDQALATFNFLNSEKRYIAGAFVPPAFIDNVTEEDEYHALMTQYLKPGEKDLFMGKEEVWDVEGYHEFKKDRNAAWDEFNKKKALEQTQKTYGGKDDGPPEKI